MIAVGLGKARHDCSIAASVDGVARYAKYERDVGIKHACAPEWWYYSKLAAWGIDPKKVDMWVSTDGGHLSDEADIPRLPYNNEESVWRKDGMHILDHHWAHAWSRIDGYDPQGENYVVLDGRGSNNYNALISDWTERYRDISVGTVLARLATLMGIADEAGSDGAGKIMGLVAYGKIDGRLFQAFKDDAPHNFGALLYHLENYYPNKSPDNQEWLDAIHTVNEICYNVLKYRYFDYVQKVVQYTGGCAMNVEWNYRLRTELNLDLIIPPHAYDGGLSIGCLSFAHSEMDEEAPTYSNFPFCQDDEAPDTHASPETINKVAELLADGKIVGWYQGHGEIGPRALGNRSILMRPDLKDGKQILNDKVKKREWWRPFGASILQDSVMDYFHLPVSKYMTYATPIRKSGMDAITHQDGTCRYNTVSYDDNPLYHDLLTAFESKTGLPLVLNTSLNMGGKPIASTVAEAYELYRTSKMDALCVGDTLYA